MRMVRAGARPSAAAAACRLVVLNGVWMGPLRDFLATSVTLPVPAARAAPNARCASAWSLKRAVAWLALKPSPAAVAIWALMTQ